MEVYADRRGNLTAKSFFKSKEGVSQRAMLLNESSTLTSVTDGATLSVDAKLPEFFDKTSHTEDSNTSYRIRKEGERYRLVKEGAELDWLESLGEDELVHVYRNVQILPDGTMASHMVAYDAKTGEVAKSPRATDGGTSRPTPMLSERAR